MRLSSLFCTAVLLVPSLVLAQHTSGAASTPSSPAPSAAPSLAPPPPHTEAPSPAPTASSMSASHTSMPESHVTPSPSSPAHIPSSTSIGLNSGQATGAPHASQPETRGIVPEQKISGESRIVPAPKIGERPVEKEPEAKREEPDLKHKICENGPCKEPLPKPEPPILELRRPCLKQPCPCPPGQTSGKGGCVPVSPPVNEQCTGEQVWNGGSCVPAGQCPAGQTWNGAACVPNSLRCKAGQVWNGISCQADCSIATAGTTNAIVELSNARQQRDDECGRNPSGTLCRQLDGEYQNALAEYRNLYFGVPVECRSTLPVPESL